MAAETGFNIDGTLYELPTLDSFTMDEAQIMYDYSGLSLEDFAEPEEETAEQAAERVRRFRNPGFLRALMHIAYRRQHPKLADGEIRQLVGSANLIDALKDLADDGETDAGPPALTSAPGGSSPSGSDVSSGSSGGGSTSDSAPLAALLTATTTTR